jgi:hypothetical protein
MHQRATLLSTSWGLNWGPTSTKQRLHFRHLGRVIVAQHLRIEVDHFVRRVPTPVANGLPAHPGINEVKIINQLLDGFEGKLTTEKWGKLAKTSQDTALLDI